MDKHWRPSNYYNPYHSPDQHQIFEDGANAMLKACRENWLMFLPEGASVISKDAMKIYLQGLEVPKVE